MRSSTTTVVAIPRQRIWLLNNGIAISRNRASAALNQLAIFKCELLHVSRSLDAERGRLQHQARHRGEDEHRERLRQKGAPPARGTSKRGYLGGAAQWEPPDGH